MRIAKKPNQTYAKYREEKEARRKANDLKAKIRNAPKKATEKELGISQYKAYVRRAKEYDRPFEFTQEAFVALTNQLCHYCGGKGYSRNGVDRKNSFFGYTIANSIPCCKRCNVAKSDMSYDEFLNHIKVIYSHLFKQP